METGPYTPARKPVLGAGIPRVAVWLPVTSVVLMLAVAVADAVHASGSQIRRGRPSPEMSSGRVPSVTAPSVTAAATRAGTAPKSALARSSGAHRSPVQLQRRQISSKSEFGRLQMSGLEDAWSREQEDSEWSSNVRDSMDAFLQTAEVDPAALRAVDCRASLCRLELDFSNPDSLGRIGKAMGNSGGHFRSGWLPQHDGGPRVAVVYLPREDLPAE